MATKEIKSILQRLKRANDAIHQPPNQAQARLGRSLGAAFLRTMNETSAHEILEVFKTCNPAVPHAFFQAIKSSSVPAPWISTWIQQVQDHPNIVQALLSFYVWHCRQASLKDELDGDRIANTYLQLQANMKVQFTTLLADQNLVRPLLSPIMATSVLTLSTSLAERNSVLDVIFRSCWSLLRQKQLSLDSLSWLVESLIMLLDSSPGDMLSHPWLVQILDLMASIEGTDVTVLFETVIKDALPRIGSSSLPTSALLQVSRRCSSIMSDKAIFDVMTMILSTPIQDDCRNLLSVLHQLSKGSSAWTAQLCRALSSIFGQDEELASITTKMRFVKSESKDQGALVHILGIESRDLEPFLELASSAIQKMDASKIPILQQNNLLLLACGLLLESESDSAFTKILLQKFPHLGVSLLPVLLDSIQASAGDGKLFLSRLQFLCESVAHDPHCAQEVWSLVSGLMQKNQPLSIRLAAIRVLSVLCASNRRLYRRTVDSLGNFVEERQAEIRLAVIAIVCKMAQQDQIRDVSDVIGWVQTYLTDEMPSIVHMSIMSLHYLVENGELDFNLVVKVLGKRLCAVGDVDQVVQLPPIVVEALVILLGDGEAAEDSDDDDNGVSPQVRAAVDTLLALADSSTVADLEPAISARITFNILQSLSNYSLEALGVDEDSIKAATTTKTEDPDAGTPEVAHRYILLCKLATSTIGSPLFGAEIAAPVEVLAQKLVHLEEAVLGTTIWQKGHKSLSDTKKVHKTKASKSALSALPKPESIFQQYESDPSASTAIAALLCFEGTQVDRLADFAGDLSNETLSPTMRLLNIQGWLHAMSRVWAQLSTNTSVANDLSETVNEIREWLESVGDVDYVYLALSSLSLYAPHNLRLPDGSTIELGSIVDAIISEVDEAFEGHQFTDIDIGYLCIAFIGVRSLHAGSSATFEKVLNTLLKAIPSGSGSIGLFFGLSFMAQTVPTGTTNARSMIAVDRRQRQLWVGQIAGCLIGELQSCFDESSAPVVAFAASLSSASVQPGLMDDLESLGSFSIQSTLTVKSTALLMSLGACMQSLIGIHPDFFHSAVQIMLHLPRESGAEYVLSSIVSNATTASVLKQNDLNLLKAFSTPRKEETTPLYLSASLANGNSEGIDWLQQNGDALGAGMNVMALIPFMGSFPILTTGTLLSLASAKLAPHSSSKSVAAVLDIIASANDEDRIMLKGLFASMSLNQISSSLAISASSASPSGAKTTSLSVDGKRLPTPNDSTLLYQLVSLIRTELDLIKAETGASLPLLCHLLRSLTKLSLPGQFATNLLGPIIRESSDGELKVAALQLLLSQFTGRRRAAMEGKDFVDLGVRVMSLQETDLFNQQGSIFFSGLSDLIRKSSTDLAESIVSRSWQNCLFSLAESDDATNALMWLRAMKPILVDMNTTKSMALSPRTSSIIQLFITDDVFDSLVLASSQKVDLIFDEVINCLVVIPFAVLDDRAFFDLSVKRDRAGMLWRVRCISRLLSRGYIEEKRPLQRTLASLFSWFSKLRIEESTDLKTQRASVVVASAFDATDLDTMTQVVQLRLEAMLIIGHDCLALQLLALIVNTCSTDKETNMTTVCLRGTETLPTNLSGPTLTSMLHSIVQETPNNLGSFAKRTKAQRVITNRLVQIHNSWTESGAPLESVDLLVRMINSCKSLDSSEKDAVAIMATKLGIER